VDEPLTLARADELPIGYVSDLYVLLRAIDQVMPRDAVLCIEGASLALDVASFLEARQPPHPPTIAANTLGPKNEFFHLPLTGNNLSGLRVLAERHAEPEIADHLVVYRDRDVLLWAHDVGSGYVSMSRQLSEATVEAFRQALGKALQPATW
jgi:hypothetical protein